MNQIWLFPAFLLVRRIYVEVRDRLHETFPSSRRLVQIGANDLDLRPCLETTVDIYASSGKAQGDHKA
jgi:hypothetical protein